MSGAVGEAVWVCSSYGWTLTVSVAVVDTSSLGVWFVEALMKQLTVVPITGATTVSACVALNSGGVGCPVNSLKVEPKLRVTGVSDTNTEVDWVGVGVNPVRIGVNYDSCGT